MTDPATIPLSELRLGAGSATHPGLRRRSNEDSLLTASPVFLVADGMGGHEAGEVASALAVESFGALAGRPSVAPAEVRDAFDRARTAIARLAHAGSRRAGTTVSGVAVTDVDGVAHWLVFNLGDSRTYRFGGGELEQISVDHSVVQELLDEGSLDSAAAAVHPERNVITRALGGGGASQPDYWVVPVQHGDRILVCSDGVSGELDRAALERVLREEPVPQEAAVRLVHEGVLRGGRDNLTAVVVDATDARVTAAEGDGQDAQPGSAESGSAHDEDTIPRGRVGAGGRS
ncbi:protein phosphatase 2C domain-containing protein [Herbiconiux moechotypicola]|uniref:Protein phosphatase 2C domain-containing protein n=1 Tax=Herbiconiux moechotypicola TaxID=637393 RepID=A0ABN3DCG7_9MICO|nr:protein phosphatase 2C domain-containing protein [Herbiconiux moechotypicola]MCS5728730.1 protein phosphatase 2C domain-containing protein [Herbiconiux moechotypicola]